MPIPQSVSILKIIVIVLDSSRKQPLINERADIAMDCTNIFYCLGITHSSAFFFFFSFPPGNKLSLKKKKKNHTHDHVALCFLFLFFFSRLFLRLSKLKTLSSHLALKLRDKFH